HLLDDLVQARRQALQLDARHHALVAPAAVEAVQALHRNAHQPHAVAPGERREVLRAGVVPRFIEKDLDDGAGLRAQAGEDRVKTENDSRLALTAHAGTRSIFLDSRSTRTSFTLIRSA